MPSDAERVTPAWTRGPAAALVLLAVWLLATAALHPLLLPDEGRYVGVAFAMLHGDAWVPTLHGLPFFHKPPLMYWIDLLAFRAFGAHEWSARVAPALGAWMMGLALWLELSRHAGGPAARLGLLVLATMPGFFLGGQYANHDMLVAGWISLTIVGAARAVEPGEPARMRWLALAWGAAALGVLSKGLIGIVLPMLVIAPWLAAQRRWRDLLRLLHPAGLALFALVVAPWFVAMQARYPGFLDYIVVEQHFRRYTQADFNNQMPFWFFFAVLPLLALPWSLRLVTAFAPEPASPRRWLWWWWVAVVLVFFSLPRSKLVGYVLPAIAPLAALIATRLASGRALKFMAIAAATLCLGLVMAVTATMRYPDLSAAPARRALNSYRDIGLALGARLQPGDRVVFVDAPFYDVPFYARMTSAPVVLSDWDDPTIDAHDNWRKELHDGVRFDPAAGARQLWPTARAEALRCGVGTVWLVATTQSVPLADAQVVERGRQALLLRAAGRPAADCR